MEKDIPSASASAPAESQSGPSNLLEMRRGNDDNDHQEERQQKHSHGKRKGDFSDARMRHGGKGFRDDNKRHKKGDMGRGEYLYVTNVLFTLVSVSLTLTQARANQTSESVMKRPMQSANARAMLLDREFNIRKKKSMQRNVARNAKWLS
jgi:Ni/Co efflux regulator RcnB